MSDWIIAEGYNVPELDLFPIESGELINTDSLYVSSSTDSTKVWHPPMPAVSGTTTTYSSSVVEKVLNRGWNTSARSIALFDIGDCCVFNVADGVSGAILGVAPKGADGDVPRALTHAIVCDVAGVHIRENNITVTTLKDLQTSVSILRIHRQTDGSIVYVATTATETLVYTSNLPLPKYLSVYVYGLLYSTGDKVLDTDFANYGDVQYGAL